MFHVPGADSLFRARDSQAALQLTGSPSILRRSDQIDEGSPVDLCRDRSLAYVGARRPPPISRSSSLMAAFV